MRAFSLTHLSDAALLRDLSVLVARDRRTTAWVLAHIAEVDARRLYLQAGYDSMYAYCVGALRFSEDAARKRVHAGRVAQRVPAVFAAVAEGRLHLSAVVLLAPHLSCESAAELLTVATHKSKSEIEELLAARFPKLDVPSSLVVAPMQPQRLASGQRAPGRVGAGTSGHREGAVSALAPERFELHATIDGATRDLLRYATELLSHAVPSGALPDVLRHVLETAVGEYEKRKFGAGRLRRSGKRISADPRRIPPAVKEAVWKRDQGRCSFVAATGHRCGSRRRLEFDHVLPVARGGRASVENLRLRCRPHNQHEAERAFGAGFMEARRDGVGRRSAAGRVREGRAAARNVAALAAGTDPEAAQHARDVYAGLRGLGMRADRARRAAEHGARLEGATLEERMRAALRFDCPIRGVARLNGGTEGAAS